jgi:hypothetical protein
MQIVHTSWTIRKTSNRVVSCQNPIPNIPETSDPLAETLHMLRLTGTLYCRGELTAPWAIAIPRLKGVMIFMVVTSGACWLELEGEEPRLLQQGSLALIPHSTPHVISSAAGLAGEPLFDLPVEKVSERYEIMRHGGGGALTRTMYGVVRFDDVAAEHLLGLLAADHQFDAWDDQTGGWLQSTLRFIASEAASLKPGGETVITRLSDVVVIQAIRSWLETSPTTETGWLAALRDPQIGKALALMHRRPGTGMERGDASRSRWGCRARPLRRALHESGGPDAAPIPDRMADACGAQPADRHDDGAGGDLDAISATSRKPFLPGVQAGLRASHRAASGAPSPAGPGRSIRQRRLRAEAQASSPAGRMVPTSMPFQFFIRFSRPVAEFAGQILIVRKQLCQHRADHRLGAAGGAVLAFERDTVALLGYGGTEDALGAGLCEDPAWRDTHQGGTGAAGAGDMPGLGHAGSHQPLGGLGALRPETHPTPCGQSRARCSRAALRRWGSSSRRCRNCHGRARLPVRSDMTSRTEA